MGHPKKHYTMIELDDKTREAAERVRHHKEKSSTDEHHHSHHHHHKYHTTISWDDDTKAAEERTKHYRGEKLITKGGGNEERDAQIARRVAARSHASHFAKSSKHESSARPHSHTESVDNVKNVHHHHHHRRPSRS